MWALSTPRKNRIEYGGTFTVWSATRHGDALVCGHTSNSAVMRDYSKLNTECKASFGPCSGIGANQSLPSLYPTPLCAFASGALLRPLINASYHPDTLRRVHIHVGHWHSVVGCCGGTSGSLPLGQHRQHTHLVIAHSASQVPRPLGSMSPLSSSR